MGTGVLIEPVTSFMVQRELLPVTLFTVTLYVTLKVRLKFVPKMEGCSDAPKNKK
jgi:hypothetical protein